MSDQEIFEKLKQKDKVTIERQYVQYKEAFHSFIKKNYRLDDDSIKDIYQEAWYAFYRNIQEGRLLELTATIKTYLFRIGRNQALIVLKSLSKSTDEKEVSDDPWENMEEEDDQLKKQRIIVTLEIWQNQ